MPDRQVSNVQTLQGPVERFDLAPAGGDQQAEVDPLVCLGTTRLEVGQDGTVMLADPDGNEFCVNGN
jgi:hypothetical protein